MQDKSSVFKVIDSNTTLVKVKYLFYHAGLYLLYHSNTTLVKVKLFNAIVADFLEAFKYNSC